MYMCMYACTCMSCIYSMSCQLIQKYMYVSIRSPSRHHLQVARCQRQRWQYQRLEIFVWECRGNWGSWTSWSFCSPWLTFWEPQSCPPNRPTFLWPLGEKIEFAVLAGRKSWLRNEGRDATTGMGREQELRDHDGSFSSSASPFSLSTIHFILLILSTHDGLSTHLPYWILRSSCCSALPSPLTNLCPGLSTKMDMLVDLREQNKRNRDRT